MDLPPDLPRDAAPAAIYEWLTAGARVAACDAFDMHVLACIMTLALAESAAGKATVPEACGLGADDLRFLVGGTFPRLAEWCAGLRDAVPPVRAADEACLRALLRGASADGSRLERLLADMVARRCQRPNHLWQDLGLRSRRELGWLMERHFPVLAQRNRSDMKWKKFFYRTICRDEGSALCLAPSCSECDDFENCFGDEGGESLLARVRRNAEIELG